MINKVKTLLFKHKSLFIYTLLNYIDKFIAFCLPLAVLYITKDQKSYNDIEYVFSLANIVIVFMELGLKTYFFYGYKIAENREKYVHRVKHYFQILLGIYLFLSILAFPCLFFAGFSYVYIFICIRALYLLYTNFLNGYFRLIDKPSLIYWYSIPVNVFSIVLVTFVSIIKVDGILWFFFVSQGFLVLYGVTWLKRYYSKEWLIGLIGYIKTAVSYSWPIILNVLLISYINNYAKIYAYNYMTASDMFQLSYMLRISLIIQMMHVSISGYYSKQIFVDTKLGINRKVLKLYSGFMALAVIFVFIFVMVINTMHYITKIEIGYALFLIMLYTMLWCYQGFFELYISKYGKPKIILLFSSIAAIFYGAAIFSGGAKSIIYLSLIMTGSMFINIILTIIYMKFFYGRKNKLD